MSNLYNQFLYNTQLYNSRVEALDNVGELENSDGSIVVDKWLSPLFRRFFPRHFYEVMGYDRFLQLFKYYLEWLEQGKNPFWTLSHIPELATINTTLVESLNKMRDQFSPDFRFEDFPDIDSRKFLSNAKEFYKRKGTDQSFKYLFNMLGKDIEVFKPIDDTLFIGEHSVIGNEKLIDSFYYTPFTYDVITDLPYVEWNEFIRRLNHPIGTQMFGTFLIYLANEMVIFPSVNLNHPNDADSLVNVTNTIPSSGNFTLEVSGDITDYPDPADPESVSPLVIHIGNENVAYTTKGSQAFSITTRGVYDTREESASDTTQFTVDIPNNQLVYSNRIDHYTGKVVQFATTDTLPTPLEVSTNYYLSLIELKAKIEGSISAVATSLTVEDSTGFPPTGALYVNGEIMTYSDLTGNTFTVARGQSSTTAVAHQDEDNVYLWTKVVKVSETLADALNKNYIEITDTGTGTHTSTGPGVEATLFTGFQVVRPQALVVRELIGYTSYNDINTDYLVEDIIKIDFRESADSDVAGDYFDITSGGQNPFSIGEQVRFDASKTFLTAAATDSDTTLTVDDTTDFNASGFANVGGEFVQYSGKTATTLTGVTRGQMSTTAKAHVINTTVRPRLMLDGSGNELDGVYYAKTGPGGLQFQIFNAKSDVTPIDIGTDSSGAFEVVLHAVDESDLYADLVNATVSQGGNTANVVSVSGRKITLEVTSGSFSSTATTFADGTYTGIVTATHYTSLGDSDLWERDYGDATFEDIEEGGDAFAKEFRIRFPQLRNEQARNILSRYYLPVMMDPVGTYADWQPDNVTAIADWGTTDTGHISAYSLTLNKRGIVRGYIDDYRPIIEVFPGDNLNREVRSAGEIVATVGSKFVDGSFLALMGFPGWDKSRYCLKIENQYYDIVNEVSIYNWELDRAVTITGLENGDEYVETTSVYSNFYSQHVDGDYTGKHCGTEDNYAISVGDMVEIIKLDLATDVSNSTNWIPTNDTVFSATSKGHITQAVSGATGFIRSKNTVTAQLSANISDSDTTIPLNDASQFPASGRVRIDNEYIVYTGKTATDLTGAIRGASNTSAVLHTLNTDVVSNNVGENPNQVYIEVESGTFTTNIAATLTVGNGTTSGNELKVPNTIVDVSKNNPQVNDYFYVDGADPTDPNMYKLFKVTVTGNIGSEVIVGLDSTFFEPVAAYGTANWLNLKE